MINNNNNLTENQLRIGQSSRWTKGAFDTRFSAVLIHPTNPMFLYYREAGCWYFHECINCVHGIIPEDYLVGNPRNIYTIKNKLILLKLRTQIMQ
jgi:hypothetical protein